MSHRNARTTFHGRMLIVQRYRAGWPQAQIAAAMGLSRKCVATWIGRHAREGEAGLVDRSSRPHRMPTRTSDQLEAEVVAARTERRCGREQISEVTGVPARTVSRILARHQMPPLAVLDPMTGQVIRASKHTTIRYERARPGELVHMDIKILGRIPDGGGWRARGQSPANHQSRIDKKPVGVDYVHSMVDDHSRLAYCEVLPDQKGPTCAAFTRRAAAYFADHGITRIERIMTDNAWAYQWSLRAVAAELGAKQKFIRPHCPWQNGKVERLNRTLLTEWAYRQPFTTNHDRTDALAGWLEHYNTERRHDALGGKPPISRLLPT